MYGSFENISVEEKDVKEIMTTSDTASTSLTSLDSSKHTQNHKNENKSSSATDSSLLKFLPFTIMVFYNVSGGPFGIEATVYSSGPLLSILGFTILPFIWSLPEALVTAELGSRFPDASGGVRWVEEAFGFSAGLFMGYISWVSGATDNAIYPVLFLDYLLQIIKSSGSSEMDVEITENDYDDDDVINSLVLWKRVSFIIGTATILTYINYLGINVVGKLSIIISIISMSPFLVMLILGVNKIKMSRLLIKTDNVAWRPYLNNLFWNLNSFDAGANYSTECQDIESVYSRGMHWSVVLVALGYLIPLIVALGAVDSNQEDWVDGYMATIASRIGGKWLGDWVVVAAAVTNIALFLAELSTDSFQLMGMGVRGLIPKVFETRSSRGTPIYGILVCYLVVVVLSFSDFSALVEMLNFSYMISVLFEYSAFIKLRMDKKYATENENNELRQHYKIPLNLVGCILMIIPSVTLMFVLISMASKETYLYFLITLLVGICVSKGQEISRDRGWFAYNNCNEKVLQSSDNICFVYGEDEAGELL